MFEHEFHFKAISSLQVCSCVCVQPEVWEDKHWHNHIAPNQHQKKTSAPINNHFAPNQYKYFNRIEANEKDILSFDKHWHNHIAPNQYQKIGGKY